MRYIIVLITLFLPFAAFAQRDIKTFEGKTTAAVIDLIGKPLVLPEDDDTTEDADVLTCQDTRLALRWKYQNLVKVVLLRKTRERPILCPYRRKNTISFAILIFFIKFALSLRIFPENPQWV